MPTQRWINNDDFQKYSLGFIVEVFNFYNIERARKEVKLPFEHRDFLKVSDKL